MISRVLVANRGEIAVRLVRAVAEHGASSVAVYSSEDAAALHVRAADDAVALEAAGAGAYLDGARLIEIARRTGCDALHPGYGFLSENAGFAAECAAAGIVFIGPEPETLALFGDKAAARRAAVDAGVAVLPGTDTDTDLRAAQAFFERHGPLMVKAVAGGGGRGIRAVTDAGALPAAFERCRSEATAAFGNGALYVEKLLPRARHIEVQVLGDGAQAVHLGERDCSIQRRNQKLIEFAPSPGLPRALRDRICAAAVEFARGVRYRNAGTFEFLVDCEPLGPESAFAFMEANARLQVEHTVTEEVTGVDLVLAQLELAAGRSLADIGLADAPEPRGHSVQVRINLERMAEDGGVLPSGGTLTAFDPPSGPGIRVDTFGYTGYATTQSFDSLLAKLIATRAGGTAQEVLAKAYRALCSFRIEGVATNIALLQNLVCAPEVREGAFHTRLVDEKLSELVVPGTHARLFHDGASPETPGLAGARVDSDDPLAVLAYGREAGRGTRPEDTPLPAAADGTTPVPAPLQGTVVSIEVEPGTAVAPGQPLLVMESMKMEHEVPAPVGGVVRRIAVAAGDTIHAGHALAFVEEREIEQTVKDVSESVDLDAIRPDLAEVVERHDRTLDAARPGAVERRRRNHQRTIRENVDDLCDPGTFVEYGPLVVAAQRRRRTLEDLIANTPADGMITGVGSVNGGLFEDPVNRCAVFAYDYTVLAGTQGAQNHRKTDRLIDVAEDGRMPVVLFAEGGGGRPGDTDMVGSGGGRTFSRFAQLSALVPMVGIVSGRCFAGNASLLGCCDVIIATDDTNLGMGGPAMIEGGGLGVFAPEDIGPMAVQRANGVVDLAVADEAEAVAAAKRYLAYFQGPLPDWAAPDQRQMRRIVPENRLRVYEIREVIETLADTGSVLELRRDFGDGMVTALVRIEGRPVGVVANNPKHLGGAIDSDGADKGARFMQVCDAFDIPLLYLCDTPGIMVGPDVEHTALVRHSSRMFVVGANLSVPFFTVIVRKAYGLGAIAMAGGSYKAPFFSVAWPTGEFGGMGLEGSVKLGFRKELEAIDDGEERMQAYEEMVARAYEAGKALNTASHFGIDDTIDPAGTRWWLASLLASIRPQPRTGKKRPAIDAW